MTAGVIHSSSQAMANIHSGSQVMTAGICSGQPSHDCGYYGISQIITGIDSGSHIITGIHPGSHAMTGIVRVSLWQIRVMTGIDFDSRQVHDWYTLRQPSNGQCIL